MLGDLDPLHQRIEQPRKTGRVSGPERRNRTALLRAIRRAKERYRQIPTYR